MTEAEGAPPSSNPSADQPVRVLLVDDHPVVRFGLKTLLCADPALDVIAEADNGEAAVRLAAQLAPELIIMDLSLPVMSGLDATRAIKRASPATKVLVLSVHEDPHYAKLLLDAGAEGYVLKLAAWEELLRAVHVIAAGGRYVDPKIARELASEPRSELGGHNRAPALSAREEEVMRMLVRGLSMKEIASELELSTRTLETYKVRAMSKLRLKSRAELVHYGLRVGWLAPE
jgi:DNA-binding NarL/FixJ family response regulator